jgi:drug/metabolite transporter (DMT)-like permease
MTTGNNVLLRVAAAVMLGGQLAWFITHPSISGAAVLLAVGILAWLLLRGSRIAWVLAVFSGAVQTVGPLAFGQPIWFAASGMILLVCLLHPSSRAIVWTE